MDCEMMCTTSLNLAIVYKWVGLLLPGSERGTWVWCHVTYLEVDILTCAIRSCPFSHVKEFHDILDGMNWDYDLEVEPPPLARKNREIDEILRICESTDIALV